MTLKLYYYVLCKEFTLLQFNTQQLFVRGSFLAVTSEYIVID